MTNPSPPLIAFGREAVRHYERDVVDAQGRYVTPGIIDSHSHLGVNPAPGVPVVITAGRRRYVQRAQHQAARGERCRYGLSWDDALRAITLTPAEVFGIETTVGSLTVGKDANLVLWEGDPFEFATRAERSSSAASRCRVCPARIS